MKNCPRIARISTNSSREIPLKEFVVNESVRRGHTMRTVYSDICPGRYTKIRLRRKNARVVFVVNAKSDFVRQIVKKSHGGGGRPKEIFV